jgi:hypothetical protein
MIKDFYDIKLKRDLLTYYILDRAVQIEFENRIHNIFYLRTFFQKQIKLFLFAIRYKYYFNSYFIIDSVLERL